MVIISSI